MARIAIVDDSRLARTYAATALKGYGHEVREIDPASLFTVLESLKADPPDVLVVDFLMPLCPGLSLVQACHEDEVLKSMRMIIVTAHRDDEALGGAEGFGVSHVMLKPVPPEVLAAAVADALAKDIP